MATKKQEAAKPAGKANDTKPTPAKGAVAKKAAVAAPKKATTPVVEPEVPTKAKKSVGASKASVPTPEVVVPEPKPVAKRKAAEPPPVKAANKPVAKKPAAKEVPEAPVAKAKAVKKVEVAEVEVPKALPKVEEKAPVKPVAPAKPAGKTRKDATPVRKVIPESSLDRRAVAAKAANNPAPKPTPTPAARPIEKRPQVIIAHRKLENKSKTTAEQDVTPTFQPEVYRSILDEPVSTAVTVYRYSDEELQEFRELINSRLESARKELAYLQGVITRKDEAGTEDTENRYMNMEDGSGAMEREQLAQLAGRQIQFVNHLEKALIRIENKTYGICRVTGKLIEKARLRAVPHATLSIEAKKMMGSSKQN
jgi:RNA polymerase-binding transcription factor DksA